MKISLTNIFTNIVKYKFIIFFIVIVCVFQKVNAQTDTVFWFAIPNVTDQHGDGNDPRNAAWFGGQPGVFVISATGPTTVTLTMPAYNPAFKVTKTFSAPGRDTIDLTKYIKRDTNQTIENIPYNTVLNKGILIRSSQNYITAYYDLDNSRNRDIFTLKGNNGLGTSFTVPFQYDNSQLTSPSVGTGNVNGENSFQGYNDKPISSIEIVATENNTVINITPPVKTRKIAANATLTITLNRGQSYSVQALDCKVSSHMGGTKITSNKKIAVIVKDDSVYKRGTNGTAMDLQGDQIVPDDILGQEYIIMRGRIKSNCSNMAAGDENLYTGEQAYIYAAEPNTKVSINGGPLKTITNAGGLLIDSIKSNSQYILADKPVAVYHTNGIGCETGGALIPKIDGCTGSRSVSFVRSTDERFYLNIMTTTKGVGKVLIDYFSKVSNSWVYNEVIPAADFEPVAGTDWWVLKYDRKDYAAKIKEGTFTTVHAAADGDRFHLGYLNGVLSGTGNKYGYFSDYGMSNADAGVGSAGGIGSVALLCLGKSAQLLASGGSSYVWTKIADPNGLTYLNDPTLPNPTAIGLPTGYHHYNVDIINACDPSLNKSIPVDIEVGPLIIADFVADKYNLCSSALPASRTVVFKNKFINSDVHHAINFGDGSPNTGEIEFSTDISHVFPENNGISPVEYKVILHSFYKHDATCNAFDTIKIIVNPAFSPAISATSATTICNPGSVSLKNMTTGDINNLNYDWDFGDGTHYYSGVFEDVTHGYFKNKSLVDTVYNIKLTATSKHYSGCKVTTPVIPITLTPYVNALFSMDTTELCSYSPVANYVGLKNLSQGNITSYSWKMDHVVKSTAAPAYSTKIYQKVTNNTNTTEYHKFQLIVTNYFNCKDSLDVPVQITVHPYINANILAPVDTVSCNPFNVTFQPQGNTPSVTYNWDFGDGVKKQTTTASAENHLYSHFSSNDTVFWAKLKVDYNNKCQISVKKGIGVKAYIKPSFAIDKVKGCSGFTSTIKNTSTGGITKYTWNFGDGTAVAPITAKRDTSHVYINPTSSTVTYWMKLTVENAAGCQKADSVKITVDPGVVASFNTINPVICDSLKVYFENTTDMTKVNTVRWEFGDNTSSSSIDPTISHLYSHFQPTQQTYQVKLITSANTGCIDTMIKFVSVYPYYKADFTLSKVEECSDVPLTFINTSLGNKDFVEWDFDGNGTFETSDINNVINRSFTNNSSGNYTVAVRMRLISSDNACGDTSSIHPITINPAIKALFVPDVTAGCDSLQVTFTNNTDLGTVNWIKWDFGDGTTSASLASPIIHVFKHFDPAPKTFHVQLIAATNIGCTDTMKQDITVYPYIKAAFSVNKNDVCYGQAVQFTNNSQGEVLANKYWDFDGDGTCETLNNNASISRAFTNVTSTTLPISVKLRVVTSNGLCADESSVQVINVDRRVEAAFTTDKTEGCYPLQISTFTNGSSFVDPNSRFLWEFGDGTSYLGATPANHTYNIQSAHDSTYYIKLTMTSELNNNCVHSITLPVTNYAYVKAGFILSSAGTICSNSPVSFQNTSSPGATHHYWDFSGLGTGNKEINSPIFDSSLVNNDVAVKGIKVTLISRNEHACYDMAYQTVNVYPQITPSFTISVTEDCQPLVTTFTNTSPGLGLPGNNFYWNFGGGFGAVNNAATVNQTFNNPTAKDSVFKVALVIDNGICTDTTKGTVKAYARIEADFNTVPSICSDIPFTIYRNQKYGEVNRYWTYSNGNRVNTLDNAVEIPEVFQNTGTSPRKDVIKLVVTNNYPQCKDSVSHDVIVYPHAQALFSFQGGVDQGCEPVSIGFVNSSKFKDTTGSTYAWDFGGLGSSINRDPAAFSFSNNEGTDKSYTITLKEVTKYGCEDVTSDDVIAYAHIEADFIPRKPAVCAPDPVELENTVVPGNKHYFWDFDGNGTTDGTSGSSVVSNIYQNISASPVNYNIVLKVQNDHPACEKTANSLVTIYPQVLADFTYTDSIGCQPLTVTQFINKSNIKDAPGVKFYWSFDDGGTSFDKDPVGHQFVNTSNEIDTFKVRLQVKSSVYSCSGYKTKNIIVYPFIKAGFFIPDANVCSNEKVTIYNSPQGNVTYNSWKIGEYPDQIITSPEIYRVFSNETLDTMFVKIRQLVTYQNNSDMCYDSITQYVKVFPGVFADFSTDVDMGCQPLKVVYKNISNMLSRSGSTFDWSFGDGSTATIKNPVTDTLSHIYPNLTELSKQISPKFKVTSREGCVDSSQTTILVYPVIKAGFSVDTTEICSGESIGFKDASSKGTSLRKWNLGDSLALNDLIINKRYINTNDDDNPKEHLVYLLSYFDYYQCKDSIAKTVKVYPEVRAKIEALTSVKGCDSLKVTFGNKTNKPAVNFNWNYKDGSNSNEAGTVEHTFGNITTVDKHYWVRLDAASLQECKSSDSIKITVYPYLYPNFGIPDVEVCHSEKIKINDASKGGIVKRKWDFDNNGVVDATNIASPFEIPTSNVGLKDSIKTVRLTIENHAGCSKTITKNIIIHPKAVADFEYIPAGCTPFTPKFRSASRNVSVYEWDFGDGGTSTFGNPGSKEYVNNTENDIQYTVKLKVSSMYLCKDSIEKPVVVAHRPVARIAVDKIMACSPFNLTINNNTKTSGSTYKWNYGEGEDFSMTDKSSINHIYTIDSLSAAAKPYNIRLKAISNIYNCVDSTSQVVSVYPRATANFEDVKADCNPIETVLNSQKSINVSEYKWNFDDGTNSSQGNPNHLFVNSSDTTRTFYVKLSVVTENKCTDSIVKPVVVYASPNADFQAKPVAQFFPNATFTLQDKTNKGPWTYNWDFDNGESLTYNYHDSANFKNVDSVVYTYPHWGTYKIRLKVFSAKCSDTSSQNIVLYAPRPIARFGPGAEGCMPLTIKFNSDSSEYVEEYFWEFDDGTTTRTANPAHTFFEPGEYNVKLTVNSEGGVDTHYEMIKVYKKPVVDFYVEPQLVMLPDDYIRCFNNTFDASQYKWYFGDGDTTDIMTPDHYYKELGTYTVKLVAWTDKGCVDSLERVNVVQVMGKGKIVYPNAFTPNMTGSTGGSYDPNATDNNVFFPYHEGVAQYHLEIYNRWGELLFTSNDVNIGWDGYYKGKLVKQDVYVYKVKGKYYNGRTFTKTGDVTVLHRNN